MELFRFSAFNYFHQKLSHLFSQKSSILDVWVGSGYVCVYVSGADCEVETEEYNETSNSGHPK